MTDLKELRRRSGTGFIWLRIGNSGLLCRQQYIFGFHKMRRLFEQLMDCQLLKKNFALKSRSVSQPATQSVSCPVSQPFSQSVSQAASLQVHHLRCVTSNLGRGWDTSKQNCLLFIKFLYSIQKRYFQLNMYNTTDEISLKVLNMHLHYDHTLYSFPLYIFL